MLVAMAYLKHYTEKLNPKIAWSEVSKESNTTNVHKLKIFQRILTLKYVYIKFKSIHFNPFATELLQSTTSTTVSSQQSSSPSSCFYPSTIYVL